LFLTIPTLMMLPPGIADATGKASEGKRGPAPDPAATAATSPNVAAGSETKI
jgi:hypothetical protein